MTYEAQNEALTKIHILMDNFHKAAKGDARDEALQDITEYPLSVSVRNGWYQPHEGIISTMPQEYEIQLSGGPNSPTININGELNNDIEDNPIPITARMNYVQEGVFSNPRINMSLSETDTELLMDFVCQFYYGKDW